jgi:hypothetical protein
MGTNFIDRAAEVTDSEDVNVILGMPFFRFTVGCCCILVSVDKRDEWDVFTTTSEL